MSYGRFEYDETRLLNTIERMLESAASDRADTGTINRFRKTVPGNRGMIKRVLRA